MALERQVDQAFVRAMTKLGAKTIKLSTLGVYGTGGWPDRLVLLPGGCCCFVELKAPGKRPTAKQAARLEELRALGFSARWFDDADLASIWVRQVLHNEEK